MHRGAAFQKNLAREGGGEKAERGWHFMISLNLSSNLYLLGGGLKIGSSTQHSRCCQGGLLLGTKSKNRTSRLK